jgi:hypothetical protein
MLKDLILQATKTLNEAHPSNQQLVEVENALSAYLEAIATERISESIDIEELEHAHRLLREIRRERSRRLADKQQQSDEAIEKNSDEAAPEYPGEQVKVSPDFN